MVLTAHWFRVYYCNETAGCWICGSQCAMKLGVAGLKATWRQRDLQRLRVTNMFWLARNLSHRKQIPGLLLRMELDHQLGWCILPTSTRPTPENTDNALRNAREIGRTFDLTSGDLVINQLSYRLWAPLCSYYGNTNQLHHHFGSFAGFHRHIFLQASRVPNLLPFHCTGW